ncbi:MAG TPA: hypothetical protein VLT36_10160 [Candidatus Dormibacteraeota bacterium]|nr:hypothetical protein [Candidatus Dormibacteraeota bacterium]
MTTLKWILSFAAAYFLISLATFSVATALWFRFGPKAEVFAHSPFTFQAKAGHTYTLLLGNIGSEQPSPAFDTVTLAAEQAEGRGQGLEVQRDAGGTQLSLVDPRFGNVSAVSVGSVRPPASGPIRVSIAGWEAQGHVYLIDTGMGWMVVGIFAVGAFNIVLSVLVVRWVSRRRLLRRGITSR